MSGGVITVLTEETGFVLADQTAEPQTAAEKKPLDSNSEEEEEVKEEEEEEEEAISSAHLEPTTLPWPGDKDRKPSVDNSEEVWSEKDSEPEERDTGISGGSQDLSEEHSQPEEGHQLDKTTWRESMPEGERWRDDEIQQRENDKGDGSLADDEHEEEEEDDDDGEGETEWMSEKPGQGFTANVMIVRPSSKETHEEPRRHYTQPEVEVEPESTVHIYPEWTEQDDKFYFCESFCSEKMRLILATLAAALLFPLLVWGGYALLPFDSPQLDDAPIRVMYTLRCSFFATIPILLGVVVQGLARLRYSVLTPLYRSNQVHPEVAVHWHYVNESLALFLFYFLQLAVMATYVHQDLLKLVPLLTIIFVFGRLIYWLCLSLDSSVRGLGFGFSFLPILLMLGVNLFFVCSSTSGRGAVFEVAPPTTAPPPKQRWWG
ncbi:unnamed protein product [Ophioblennius macclurei]